MELSADQAEALEKIKDWQKKAPRTEYCTDPDCAPDGGRVDEDGVKEGMPHTHGQAQNYPVFTLTGLAGTGKTWLAGMLQSELGVNIAYGTPTNKAAGVLRRKLDEGAAKKVRTYHSLMFFPNMKNKCMNSGRPVRETNCGCAAQRSGEDQCDCPRKFTPCGMCGAGKCKINYEIEFILRDSVGGHRDVVLLDEASMISEQRVQEIRSLGVPVLLVGDHGQLPPVKERMNRWMMRPDVTLSENHRQADANGIVDAALRMRNSGDLAHGMYGDGSTAVVSAKKDPAVLDILNPDRMKPGPDSVVIVPLNSMRARINQRLHALMPCEGADWERAMDRKFLGHDEVPYTGDRVISLQNHYSGVTAVRRTDAGDWNPVGMEFVWNGMTGTVRDVDPRMQRKKNTVDLVIELDDTPDPAGGNVHVLTTTDARQFGAPQKLRPDQMARDAQLWDYAYAVTAHKSQGSEYSRVVVLDTNPSERKRWMYTAMTRAKDKLVVIDWRG